MAIFKKGDMWRRWGNCDLFCITTNATIKSNGALVMGRGIAKQMRDRIENSDKTLGEIISSVGNDYGLIVTARLGKCYVGAFQVKRHYRDQASLHLIRLATVQLFDWIIMTNPELVCLNFPGIGNGRLLRDDVLPIVSLLPDCVEIWEFE